MRLMQYMCSALIGLLVVAPLGAAEPAVEKLGAPTPKELAEAVREGLGPDGFRFIADGKAVGEFWFRKEMPLKEATPKEATLKEGATAPLGVSYGRLEVGTLVGVIRIVSPWLDYRNQSVPPGVYTLRYVIQPADGSHMGTSEYRDFLLLVPAPEDGDPLKKHASEELARLSSRASRTSHPAVLSLFPVGKDVSGPELMKNALGQWMVAVKIGGLTLGLVMVGHGEMEG